MTSVLCLCTGNTCRSPMAAALLAARLEERGVKADVASAGLLGDDMPATDKGRAAMAARGIDTSGHRSRRVTAALVRDADLVLAMAREHVREAVSLAPETWPRVFTLKELVRRGERVGPRRPGQSLPDWLAAVHDGRRPDGLLGTSSDDDVADPIGQPQAAYDRTATELDGLVTRLAEVLGPPGVGARGSRNRLVTTGGGYVATDVFCPAVRRHAGRLQAGRGRPA